MIGTLAGSYKITDLVNVGGMGSVYRAEHTLIGRIAAVKVLHPEMSASRDIINRFFNEARVTTSIKHPGIVEVYDFGYLESGHAYLVMEFLEGVPLSTRNKQRGPINEGEAAAILKGVCSALAAAHAKGVVHRDLKPDNIFMVPDPDAALGVRPKLLDFGIAKLTEPGLAGSATKTGAVMGTPTYMSPEQCRGTGDVDHRADLYSIGCMFYEMVAGRPPFVDRGAGELIGAHLFVNPEPPSRYIQGISPDAEALIMALLAKQPAQRPQTALELGQHLAQLAQRTGWGSSTSWEQRPSVADMQAQGAVAHPTPGHFTPGHSNPGHFTPGHSNPGFAPNAPTQPASGTHGRPQHYTPGPTYTQGPTTQPPSEKPTTLSGAASHSIATAPKSGSKWVIPAVALVVLVGGGIGIAAFMGGGKKTDERAVKATTRPAPAPTPAEKTKPTPAEKPTPAPAEPAARAKAPETTKTPEATDVPETTTPPETTTAAETVKTPETIKPSETTKTLEATKTSEATKTPEVIKTPEAAKTGSGSGSVHAKKKKPPKAPTTDPLLETDL